MHKSAEPAHSRVLIEPQARGVRACGRRQSRRKIGDPIATLCEAVLELDVQKRRTDHGSAGQSSERRPDKQHVSDQTAHRISRQSENEGTRAAISCFRDAEPERLARLQADLVEDPAHSKRRQRRRYEIALAGGNSAGDQHHVGLERLAQGPWPALRVRRARSAACRRSRLIRPPGREA